MNENDRKMAKFLFEQKWNLGQSRDDHFGADMKTCNDDLFTKIGQEVFERPLLTIYQAMQR